LLGDDAGLRVDLACDEGWWLGFDRKAEAGLPHSKFEGGMTDLKVGHYNGGGAS